MPACSACPDRGKVIKHAAALVATGTAGFLLGGAPGATVAVTAWAAVLIAWWRIRVRKAQALLESAELHQPYVYVDIDEVMHRLDDLARERSWHLGKHFEIARMACEDRTVTFDELERRYERGLRSAPDRSRHDAPKAPKMIDGMKWEIAILFLATIFYILLILSCSFSYP